MPEPRGYQVILSRSAEKALTDLQATTRKRVIKALEELAQDPRPPGARKMKGEETSWRVRVGSFRIVYRVDDDARTVLVTMIAHRREAYR